VRMRSSPGATAETKTLSVGGPLTSTDRPALESPTMFSKRRVETGTHLEVHSPSNALLYIAKVYGGVLVYRFEYNATLRPGRSVCNREIQMLRLCCIIS
jgi:hypothetical protein